MSLQSVQVIFSFQPQTPPAIMAATLRMQAGILEGKTSVESASVANTKAGPEVKPSKGKKVQAVKEEDKEDTFNLDDVDLELDGTNEENGNEEEELTKEHLITSIKDYVNTHKNVAIGRAKIAKILEEYKVKSVHDLPEKHYQAVYEAVGGQ